MRRIKLVIEYDGRQFFGWQRQKNQVTVQEKIEQALFTIFKQRISVIGSGRTDTGVHARNQIAHADIPDFDLFRLKNALNGLLSEEIVIKHVNHCEADFHSRFDASGRLYRYYISQEPAAIFRNWVWQIYFPLNLTLMIKGAEIIEQTHDFRSFCKAKSEVNHHRCTIYHNRWFYRDALLVYEISANRFLHGMVRTIVGAMVELGRGKFSLDDFIHGVESRDRKCMPFSAPAQGLILEEVRY